MGFTKKEIIVGEQKEGALREVAKARAFTPPPSQWPGH